MGDSLTPDAAYDLEQEIVTARAGQLRTWVPLAGSLHAFHDAHAWKQRGYETFNEWLAQPDVSLSRAYAYQLISIWQQLVLERGVSPNQLALLDPSKIGVVLAAVRSGKVDCDEALTDCEHMSRSDLREEYQSTGATDRVQCPTCGSKVSPASLKEAA